MKYSKKRMRLMARLAVVGGVFLGLFFVGYFFGFLRESCDSVECFNERASSCKPTDVVYRAENTVYVYSIRGSLGTCNIHVILKRIAAGAPVEFQKLEGSKMVCKIPKRELDGFSLDGFDRYMEYCHGRLKEGLYEIILTRVYSNLVGQMDDILREAEEVLGK